MLDVMKSCWLPQHERLLERSPDLVGDDRGDVDILDAGQEDGELVTTEARDGVLRAEGRQQTLATWLQQLVAGGVAEGVVHVLEAVEVEEEQREAAAGAFRLRERGRRPGLRAGACWEAR